MTSMRSSMKALLLAGGALACHPALAQQVDAPTSAAPATNINPPADATQVPGAEPPASDTSSLNEIVVTGNTSGKRTLFDSSSNVTLASQADIARKAPRNLAETLELVPGVFVEATAGPISNNYSVRGLRGGSQAFITLEEDGMPILYGGGGADFYFQNDITINRLEAVEGGTSGVLAPNGAGATINYISLKPDYDKPTASVRMQGATYGDLRADAYYSAPIADNLAFSVGGFVQSIKGQRRTPFSFNGYNVKAILEKRFDDGGAIRLTYKRLDEHNPYYADMPFAVDADGSNIRSIPGLNLKRDDVGGSYFNAINVPDSPYTGHAERLFSSDTGIHVRANTYRIDIDKPITQSVSMFAHARYLDGMYDFNGIFPGSGSGAAGLASAVSYLDPATSPLGASYYALGATTFPGTAQFGIRDVRTGQVIAASNTGALNALNGNGLLQQTVLNHQLLRTKDFGSNAGLKWNYDGGAIDNSLTVGGMFYNVRRYNDQSATATLLNDVRDNSHIYDLVALNNAGSVVGQLTNNGLLSYGNWGAGIFKDEVDSLSGYFNDELKIGEKLHVDFGARYEHEHVRVDIGQAFANSYPVPAGTPGLAQTVGSAFNGQYVRQKSNFSDWAYTGGVNYELTDNIALYVRGAHGFQTNGGDTGGTHKPTGLTLYEGGVRFKGHGFNASVIGFRTIINNLSFQLINPDNPAVQTNVIADQRTNGVQVDGDWRPISFFSVDVQGVYQVPKIESLQFDQPIAGNYSGNTPERTPKKLLTVTPSFILPGGKGEIYGRWKYIGKIFADAGDGIALPSYSVFSVGVSFNVTERINLNASVDNLTNAKGFTEGNPRQGATQSITNGFFYGRAIVGRNALVSATIKLD